jgi:hypothetical protein
MGAATLISLALTLLQSVLTSAKASGVATEVLADIEAAVQKLLTVQGTPVTLQQLESLKITTEW